jgi:hypothetical protein
MVLSDLNGGIGGVVCVEIARVATRRYHDISVSAVQARLTIVL